jgi:hypothetical protein
VLSYFQSSDQDSPQIFHLAMHATCRTNLILLEDVIIISNKDVTMEGLRKATENLKIAGDLAQFRARHLPNTV